MVDNSVAGGPSDEPEISVGDLSDLADGEMRRFSEVGSNGIVVCRVKGDLYALTDNCSHSDAPLSDGRLRGFGLTCPLHGAVFDVRDGSPAGPPAFEGVPCHSITENAGEVVLQLAATKERPPDPSSGPRTR